jgi:hypothetical protein
MRELLREKVTGDMEPLIQDRRRRARQASSQQHGYHHPLPIVFVIQFFSTHEPPHPANSNLDRIRGALGRDRSILILGNRLKQRLLLLGLTNPYANILAVWWWTVVVDRNNSHNILEERSRI